VPKPRARLTDCLLRAGQRSRISTADRRPCACLQPHTLEKESIRSAGKLMRILLSGGATNSSTKTSEDSCPAAQAMQASAQLGNAVRRGQQGGGAHLCTAGVITGPETTARGQRELCHELLIEGDDWAWRASWKRLAASQGPPRVLHPPVRHLAGRW
jgi:hypothetical protein